VRPACRRQGSAFVFDCHSEQRFRRREAAACDEESAFAFLDFAGADPRWTIHTMQMRYFFDTNIAADFGRDALHGC
jgi:hypothetical protein